MSNQQQQQEQPSTVGNSLDAQFASFAARVEKIDEAIDVNDPQTLVNARGNLAEIILELEKLHADEIEVASNTGENDKSNRSLLTTEISNLLHQTLQLYQVLDMTIEKSVASASAISEAGQSSPKQQLAGAGREKESGGSQPQDSDSDSSNYPLAREEIAKLLLLVSRAHGIGQLTDLQKSNLKMEVCLRKSYLRNILKQQDINHIMTALAEAGGGN